MYRLLLFIVISSLLSGCTSYIEPEFMRQQKAIDEYNDTLTKAIQCEKIIKSDNTLEHSILDSIQTDTLYNTKINGKIVPDNGLNKTLMYNNVFIGVTNTDVVVETRINYGNSAIYYFLTYQIDSCKLKTVERVIK